MVVAAGGRRGRTRLNGGFDSTARAPILTGMHKQSAALNMAVVPDHDPRPLPPEAPLPSDCCDSGCDPCVHDTYTEELQYYRQQLAKWLERNPE